MIATSSRYASEDCFVYLIEMSRGVFVLYIQFPKDYTLAEIKAVGEVIAEIKAELAGNPSAKKLIFFFDTEKMETHANGFAILFQGGKNVMTSLFGVDGVVVAGQSGIVATVMGSVNALPGMLSALSGDTTADGWEQLKLMAYEAFEGIEMSELLNYKESV